jgi:hypothetical protein
MLNLCNPQTPYCVGWWLNKMVKLMPA